LVSYAKTKITSALANHKQVITRVNFALYFILSCYFQQSLWPAKQRPASSANQARQCKLQTPFILNWGWFISNSNAFKNILETMKHS